MTKKKKPRRQFDEAYKIKAVTEYEAGDDKRIDTFAKKIGVVRGVFRNWVKKYGSDQAFATAQEPANGKIVGRKFRVTMLLDSIDDVFARYSGVAHSIEVETIMLTKKKRGKKSDTQDKAEQTNG